MKVFIQLLLVLIVVGLVGCETTHRKKGGSSARADTWDRSRGVSDAEMSTPGWWYARRDYDKNYMHWGKMRRLDDSSKGEMWVLLNENECKAPHRRLGNVSADNGREYRFYGYFMGQRGYEPASDELCPIFVLQKWELLSSPMGSAPAVAQTEAVAEANEPLPVPEAAEPVPAKPVAATNTVAKVAAKPAAKKTAAKTVAKPAAKKKAAAPVIQ